MARIRTVKPDLFKSENLFDAEIETKLPLRLAFIGLFTVCDREGRFKWRPRSMKTDVLPYDEKVDFSRVLDALVTRGFIVKYTDEKDDYGFIPSWSQHQVINNRESESKIPDPQSCTILPDASSTRAPRVTDLHKGKGREGKGREGEGNGRVGDAIVADAPTLTPAQETRLFFETPEQQEAVASYLSEHRQADLEFCRAEVLKFVSYWTEKTKSGKKQLWETKPTFEVKKRLATWFGNVKNFAPRGNEKTGSLNFDFTGKK